MILRKTKQARLLFRIYLITTISFLLFSDSAAQSFLPFPGFEGSVKAIALSSNGEIYAGGYFTEANGVQVDRVAKWNGSAWEALGDAFNGPVFDIELAGDDLFIGGEVPFAGGPHPQYIAQWDGSTWQDLGGGLVGYSTEGTRVNALAHDGTYLYAAGRFSRAGEIEVNNIARWNGTQWDSLGGGVSGRFVFDSASDEIYALAHDGQDLYVGGQFTGAGGLSVGGVAKWNGTSWEALEAGVDGTVYALAIGPGGKVYAGGSFIKAGDQEVNHVTMWNGASWEPLGAGIEGVQVNALGVSGSGAVFVGGAFSEAGGIPAENVARWKEGQWEGLDGGLSGSPDVITVGAENVYIGGFFTAAGAIPASNFAVWHDPTITDLVDEDAGYLGGCTIERVYPHPTRSLINVHVRTPHAGVLNASLYDMLGRRLNGHTKRIVRGVGNFSMDMSDLSGGWYLLLLDVAGEVCESKVVAKH